MPMPEDYRAENDRFAAEGPDEIPCIIYVRLRDQFDAEPQPSDELRVELRTAVIHMHVKRPAILEARIQAAASHRAEAQRAKHQIGC